MFMIVIIDPPTNCTIDFRASSFSGILYIFQEIPLHSVPAAGEDVLGDVGAAQQTANAIMRGPQDQGGLPCSTWSAVQGV